MNSEDKKRASRSRTINIAACVLLLALCGGAVAQEEEATDAPVASEQPQVGTYLGNERVESCMQRWDPGTHMTKEAWRESCERIREEREPYVKGR